MEYIKDFFVSVDGIKLITHTWKPSLQPKFLLIIIHGMGEHGKRYETFAQFFIKKNFMVTALDLRGHGESEGKRGHASSFDHIINDIDNFLQLQQKKFRNLKHILFGHSLGGNFILNYLLTKELKIYAAIALAPALKTYYELAPVKAIFAKLIRAIYPSFTINNVIKSKKSFEKKNIEKDKDTLLHNKISIEMALASIEKGEWALKNACKINLPLLIMHGTNDQVSKYDASKDFIRQVDHKFGQLKLYDGLFHNLHNEDNSEIVLEDLYNWVIEVAY